MADATQEKQVEQSEQLKEMKTSLTAITQQMMIANAGDGDTKKQFQKANQQILQAILTSNVLAETGASDDDASEAKSGKTEGSRWKNLLGHFGWAKKFAERSAKLAKLAAGSTVKFGKTKLAKVTRFAGNMLDLLLKGLGLGILWALFKWMEGKDWESISTTVKELIEKTGVKWETIVAAVNGILTTLEEWGGLVGGIWTTVKAWKAIAWIANFGGSSLALMWASLKLIFGLGGLIAKLGGTVAVWALTTMFNLTTGALGLLWSGVKLLFGPESIIGKLAISVKNWAAAGLFGETGVLTKLWRNIRTIFGFGGNLSKSPGFLRTAEELVDLKFSKEGPLMKLFNGIKGIFGAEGKIALSWKAIKESKTLTTLFGEGSHLRRLMTWIGSFFGPESNLGKAATWIGTKAKLFKDYLMVGDDVKKGGAISRLFSFVGGMFSGIGEGFKTMQKAKWFTVLKGFVGGVGKFAAAIMVPLRFLLLPFTWILGIGAAVVGFVQGFMGKEGVKDERSLTTKILDGLKGAFKGLLDFFVIDLVVMVQDLLNFMIEKVNKIATYIPGFEGFDKVTFGTDLANMSTEMLGMSEESSANKKLTGPIDIDKILRESGGKLEDKAGLGTGDKFEIGMDKFGSAIDKLDMAGLQAMANKMEEMRRDDSIELVNERGIKDKLQAEIKERTIEDEGRRRFAELQATKLAEKLAEKRIPALELAQQGGGQGGVQATSINTVHNKGSNNYLGGSPSSIDRNIIKSEGDSTVTR